MEKLKVLVVDDDREIVDSISAASREALNELKAIEGVSRVRVVK